jgi:EAL domain-containing protein (putative c-di-GMP-specific phosphodiesterase class I)
MREIENGTALPSIATLFQPIVEATDSGTTLHAVECLTRGPRGSSLEAAYPLFEYVRTRGLECEMDCACVTNALRTVASSGTERISINVHPKTLGERRDFVRLLLRQARACNVDPSRLIVEIGEQTPATNERAFRRAVAALHHHGVHVAIDDVGHGYANYKSILDCRPEYLKIDRYFVNGVSDDPMRRAVVRSICALGSDFGAAIVAEGVEQVADHTTLREMGITLFQGFLYGRPAAGIAAAVA